MPAQIVLDADGWAQGVRRVPSPHCDERPSGAQITLLVVHAISLPPGQFGGPWIEALFAGRLDAGAHPYFAGIADHRVSAHFLIRRDGQLVQFVPCGLRAWHAGASQWRGRPRCNDFSIGVELEGTDSDPFQPAQYETLLPLARALARRYPIAHAAGHDEVAPGRKHDPGPGFDRARLALALALARRRLGYTS